MSDCILPYINESLNDYPDAESVLYARHLQYNYIYQLTHDGLPKPGKVDIFKRIKTSVRVSEFPFLEKWSCQVVLIQVSKTDMNKYFFIVSLVFSLHLSAQEHFMFDTSGLDVNAKLIGYYPQYDKKETYRYLNFIVEDTAAIKKIITSLTLGKEKKNSVGAAEFRISLVQRFKEVKSWIVFPVANTAMRDGHTYTLDVGKIEALSDKYRFDYNFETISFKNLEDYQKYLDKQKRNPTFLFDYAPQFKYEGSFDVQFPRNKEFSSPKAVSGFLTPLIERIVSKGDYSIRYTLNEKNMKSPNQFTMTIVGSKTLYESLHLRDLKKEIWMPMTQMGYFFHKRN